MAWKAPWTKDPLQQRESSLAAEQQALEQQMAELRAQMEALQQPPPEPPAVWRGPETKEAHPTQSRRTERVSLRKNRARQKRDRNLFIGLALGLLIILYFVFRAIS